MIVRAYDENWNLYGEWTVATERIAYRLMDKILDRPGREWWRCFMSPAE